MDDNNHNNGQTFRLTTGGAKNFENLGGSNANETLYGDNNDNILSGGGISQYGGNVTVNGVKLTAGGTDKLYGEAGNDTLY